MFNRCVRKDQWDWLSVYMVLDRPRITVLRHGAVYLGEIARAIWEQGMQEARRLTDLLADLNIEHSLREALPRLTASVPPLSPPQVDKSLVEHPAVIRSSEEDRPVRRPAPLETKEKQGRACDTHERTLRILVKCLEEDGYKVKHSRFIDAYCRLRTGPAVFEVKSITVENEWAQCREALSQLYEYRFLHDLPDASLWLVLSSPPRRDWLVRYFRDDRGIEVWWLDGDGVAGPSADRLFESGSAARRHGNP